MKDTIKIMILSAARDAHEKGILPSRDFPEVFLETPKIEAHGDFSTNFALISASVQKMSPKKIAEAVVDRLEDVRNWIESVEVAGPGFINFHLHPSAWHHVLEAVHTQGKRYGAVDLGKGRRIQVEYVSSNPTGPLHVGHGRGAAVGDSVANILSFCGYDVQKEYYINDSGRQIETLGRSVFLRLKALLGDTEPFPKECYQGGYIRDLAREILELKGRGMALGPEAEGITFCARYAAGKITEGMREDLVRFGVTFDRWFSEQSLYDAKKVDRTLSELKARDVVYEKDGALWFRTSAYGDEKDRVVVRNGGQPTYFASDIAYHRDKFERGFEKVIDVWGADHHGYIPRMEAAVEALGNARGRFKVILVQLVNLLRGGLPVAMSTRAGEFVTLREVIDEVGKDAARFLFLTRHHESPLDFDLDLAKKQSNENPVYYVQYVHARISSILKVGKERGIEDASFSEETASLLLAHEEIQLLKALSTYPDVIRQGAVFMEPHRVTFYLMDLASLFHAYYNKHRVLTDDPALTHARVSLILAIKEVIQNGLFLLGVSAPEKM
ncbi:MAG: arginine--tRNA ligase [Desulfobacterales bacterium CG07_land_8_20_14_0_80_52_14]|nr:MAG: arginine--tRNA ligase [Desulfobacterales bacterium CG23_combo_of_CG06-09_8_20_14_all_52_9]PIU50292.1 MAG: arginine--tRNA ligase [Desulfobacterales bacterium CG07_land_8_20_14_0_80_52_14]